MKRIAILGGVPILFMILLLPANAARPEDNPDIFGMEKEPVKINLVSNSDDDVASRTEARVRFSRPGMESFAIRGEGFITPSRNYYVGKTIKYVVQVSWEGKLGDIEVEEPDPPILNNLRLVKVAPSNKISPESNRAIAEFTYHLKGMEEGKAFIGMIDANYRLEDGSGKGSFRLKEQRLKILPPKHNWGKIFLTGAGVLVGLALLGGVGYTGIQFLKRRPAPPPVDDSETTSPYERILGELASMRLFLVEGEIRDFYSKLTKLAKGFVGVTEGEEITRLTTEELLKKLEERNYNPENRDRIFSILELCDRVKFAGYIPTQSENEQVLKDFETLMRAEMRR